MVQFYRYGTREPVGFNVIGFLDGFLHESDPQPARAQLDRAYKHGGGFNPFRGFKLNPADMTLNYPGDPPTRPIAEARLRQERIIFYQHSWVAVIQPDGTYEVCRMD